MSRRKRVQVGWYCNHEDEKRVKPWAGSHISSRAKLKRGKWVTESEPTVTQCLDMLDWKDPKKRPPCPLAVPMYVLVEPEAKS